MTQAPEGSGVVHADQVDELRRRNATLAERVRELELSQRELERSRDRYRELYDLAPVAYLTLDADDRVLTTNRTATTVLGHPRHALVGGRLQSMIASESQEVYRRHRRRLQSGSRRESCEIRMERTDGGTAWLRLVSEPIAGVGSRPEAVRVTMSDITPLKRVEERLHVLNATLEQRIEERTREAEVRAAMLQAMSEQLDRTELLERHRLAELLHDSIKQELVGAHMLLASVRDSVTGGDAAQATLGQVEEVLAQAVRTCRSLNDELCPPVLRGAGRVAALEWLAERFFARHGLEVAVVSTTELEPADSTVAVALYRSVRELLFNVVKHAETGHAAVQVHNPMENLLEIIVEDHGRGFDAAAVEHAADGGFGLFGVRQRMARVGGSAQLSSRPGSGTWVRLTCQVAHGVGQAPPGLSSPTPERSVDR